MNLRKAELKDKKNIQEIIRLLHKAVHLNSFEFIWEDEEFIEKQITNEEYFLAEIDGKIVGIISFRQRGDIMYIETLVVIKEYRLQGIGIKLIEFAKQYTKEKGLFTIRACSFFEYQAVDFYMKQGFSLLKNPGEYKGYKFHRFQEEIIENRTFFKINKSYLKGMKFILLLMKKLYKKNQERFNF